MSVTLACRPSPRRGRRNTAHGDVRLWADGAVGQARTQPAQPPTGGGRASRPGSLPPPVGGWAAVVAGIPRLRFASPWALFCRPLRGLCEGAVVGPGARRWQLEMLGPERRRPGMERIRSGTEGRREDRGRGRRRGRLEGCRRLTSLLSGPRCGASLGLSLMSVTLACRPSPRRGRRNTAHGDVRLWADGAVGQARTQPAQPPTGGGRASRPGSLPPPVGGWAAVVAGIPRLRFASPWALFCRPLRGLCEGAAVGPGAKKGQVEARGPEREGQEADGRRPEAERRRSGTEGRGEDRGRGRGRRRGRCSEGEAKGRVVASGDGIRTDSVASACGRSRRRL